MNVTAILKSKCNLKKLFETLPINEKIVSLRFSKTYLEITIRFNSAGYKSIRLSKYKAVIFGCKSVETASEVLKDLKLEFSNIRETLVIYTYDLPIKSDHLLVKYKSSSFRIQDNKVKQVSKSIKDAQEAYNEFIKI